MNSYKNFLALAMFLILLSASFAQTPSLQPKPRTIQVSGSAEMEIIPDELYFTVILREYLDKDKKKVKIESLEKELQSAASAAGVSKENLQFENVYGERWKEKKGKPEEFLQSKFYVLKVSEPSKIDAVLDKIDAKGIDNVYLSRYSHTKIQQFRKELKIQAIKNAKEKAKYLLEAIGEELGKPVSISESDSEFTPVVWDLNPQYYSSNTSQSRLQYNSEYNSDTGGISFKTIKLRFAINGEFEIK